jgi:FkbM family methyltransferase
MLRRIAVLLYPRGSVRPVLRGCRKGARFVVRDAMGVNFSLGRADEEQFADRFAELISPGSDVFDVGGNRGQLALLFARLTGPNGRVISFEPMPELVADLQRNCELNRYGHVTAICAAASDAIGETTFAFSETHQTQGKMTSVETGYSVDGAHHLTVKTTTLDATAAEHSFAPAFIKIDVEGAARLVLAGARGTIAKHRPAMYVELHGPEEAQALRDFVTEFHYRLERTDRTPVADPCNYPGGPLFCLPDHA